MGTKKPSPFRSRPNHGNCCAKTKADPGAVCPKHNFRDTTLLAGRMAGHSFAARCKPGERALITVGTGCDYCAETPRFTEAAHRGWPARSLLPSRTTGGFLKAVFGEVVSCSRHLTDGTVVTINALPGFVNISRPSFLQFRQEKEFFLPGRMNFWIK